MQIAQNQITQNDEDSFLNDIVDEAVGYLDDAGINPLAKADETVGRLDDTASAYSQVNGGT